MNQPVVPQLLALVEGPNLVLDKPIVLIGRHQECDIQIPSRKISRRHCCIAQVAEKIPSTLFWPSYMDSGAWNVGWNTLDEGDEVWCFATKPCDTCVYFTGMGYRCTSDPDAEATPVGKEPDAVIWYVGGDWCGP